MHEKTGNRELDDKLAELDAREQTIELRPGARPLEPEEQELAHSLRRLSRLQAVALALIISLACLLTVMIALGHIKLPDWARPEPEIELEYPVALPPPETNTQIPTVKAFEILQAHDPFADATNLLRSHAPADLASMIEWRYNIGGDELSQPVCSANGSGYLTSNGTLYAIDRAGNLQWSWRPDTDGAGAPVLGPNGQIYTAGNNGMVYALSQSGELKWSFKAAGQISGSPLPAANGLVYVKARVASKLGNGFIYALNQNGTERWRYEPDHEFDRRALVLGPDGAVYDLHREGMLLRVNQRGGQDWQVDVGEGAKGPVVTSNAVVLSQHAPVGSDHYWQLSALNPSNGRERWHYTLPQEPVSAPVAGADGVVYVTCYYQPPSDRRLPYCCGAWAITASGDLVWQRDFEALSRVRPLFISNGKLYAASNDGDLVLNTNGEIVLGLPERDDFPTILGPGPGGRIYTQREGELIVLKGK